MGQDGGRILQTIRKHLGECHKLADDPQSIVRMRKIEEESLKFGVHHGGRKREKLAIRHSADTATPNDAPESNWFQIESTVKTHRDAPRSRGRRSPGFSFSPCFLSD